MCGSTANVQADRVSGKDSKALHSGRRVITVEAACPVIDCFVVMERNNVQAVAVIDGATDALVGNLSETDIMLLKPDAFGALALPVGEFLIHAQVSALMYQDDI